MKRYEARRNRRLDVRISEEEFVKICRLAKKLKYTISDTVRVALHSLSVQAI